MVSNFGTCMSVIWTAQGPDLGFTPATGIDVLAQSLMCRLTTPHGSVMGCPNDCIDVRDFVGSGMTQSDVQKAQAAIQAQIQRDERVLTSTVRATYNQATKVLGLTISVTSAAGPFTMTLAVSAVTVSLLNLSAN